jgi:uridine kinase
MVIEPTMAGANSISYPRAKWWPEHNPEPVINQPVTSLIIVEGVCSSRNELRDYMTIKIFVDTPRNICIERGLARDRGMGGKSEREIIDQWNQWLKWDDEYFAKDDPKSIADIIADGTKVDNRAVEATLSKLHQVALGSLNNVSDANHD